MVFVKVLFKSTGVHVTPISTVALATKGHFKGEDIISRLLAQFTG
jgi:glycerol uptake facilitator-like aquaporin